MRRKPFRGGVEHAFAARGERQHLRTGGGRARGLLDGLMLLRGLFDDHMSICATYSKGADTGPARKTVGTPLAQAIVHIKRRVREVDLRVVSLEVDGRRQQAMSGSQRSLDQSRGARRDDHVADITLDRTERAELRVLGARAECLGQRLHFDGISQRCGRAMGFHITDAARFDTRDGLRIGDDARLGGDTRGRETRLVRAVVVHGRAADHGVDSVAIGDRIGEPFEQHDRSAIAEHRAPRVRIEGARVPVGREHRAILV